MTQNATQQRAVDQSRVAEIASRGVPPELARLLASRGVAGDVAVADASRIVSGDEMLNCQKMGGFLADMLDRGQRLLIVSDYDCDGATAASIVLTATKAAGMDVGLLVPDRLKHGYGLTPSIVDEAISSGRRPNAIITVDNGISSVEGVARANEVGIDVLVTDHHLPPQRLPDATIIVNPNQPGCSFPSKNVAGCGVAWYVAAEFLKELRRRGRDPGVDVRSLLPYVAIGTIADLVKLDDNNVQLVTAGLSEIRAGRCSPGIKELVRIARRDLSRLTTTDIAFAIGPRINAAGRLAHMEDGIRCLTATDWAIAEDLAIRLDDINAARKAMQAEMIEGAMDAVQFARQKPDVATGLCTSIVVHEPDWHEGVIGIVAGKLKEDANVPVFVLCDRDGMSRGSGRSIEGFHLKHALDRINVEEPGLLVKFGGHAMAAGITIRTENVGRFTELFSKVCREEIDASMLERTLVHDGAMPRGLRPEETLAIELATWGQGMPRPIYLDRLHVVSVRKIGAGKHAQLNVRPGDSSASVDAIWFGAGDQVDQFPEWIDATFRVEVNLWNPEKPRIQISIERVVDVGPLRPAIQKAPASRRRAQP